MNIARVCLYHTAVVMGRGGGTNMPFNKVLHCVRYFFPRFAAARFLNLSTRPAVSMVLAVPV